MLSVSAPVSAPVSARPPKRARGYVVSSCQERGLAVSRAFLVAAVILVGAAIPRSAAAQRDSTNLPRTALPATTDIATGDTATVVRRDTTTRPPGTTPPPKPKKAPPPVPMVQMKVLIDADFVQGEPLKAPPYQGFGIRRARVFAQFNAPAGIGFRIQLDPSAAAVGPVSAPPFRGVPLVEAYVTYQHGPEFLVQAGQQRIPFGLVSTTGAPSLPTAEFAQYARYLEQQVSAFRDIGVTAQGRLGALEYAGGVFNGAGINTASDNDSTRDFVGRLTYSVVPGLQLSADGWKGHSGNLYVRAPNSAPLKTFYDNSDFRRYSFDARFTRGPVLLTAEYGKDRTDYNAKAVNPAPNKSQLDRMGYNVMGALRLGAIAPTLQQVELVARYDHWNANQGVAGNVITEYVGGVNYYLFERNAPDDARLGRPLNFALRESRIMAFFEHDRPDGVGTAAPTNTTRFHMRWELFF